MLLRYWAIVLAAVLVIASAALLGWSLYPKQPNISGNSGYQEEHPGYIAGGAGCQPGEIDRLVEGRERARKAIACQEAEEQHRLQANDLVQQRRAADAADAVTILTYQQTRIAAWGVGLGFLTMAAAVAAALYAKKAAEQAERSAQAFIETERGVLHAVHGEVGNSNRTGESIVQIHFANRGRASARVVEIGIDGEPPVVSSRWTVVPPDQEVAVPLCGVPNKDAEIRADCWVKYRTIGLSTHVSYFSIGVSWFEGHAGSGLAILPRWQVEVSNEHGHSADT